MDYIDDITNDMTREELVAEIKRTRDDHQGACELAWQLYCVGTEQTIDSFRGVGTTPVEDVKRHIVSLKSKARHPAGLGESGDIMVNVQPAPDSSLLNYGTHLAQQAFEEGVQHGRRGGHG